jgi:hypothetical protein
VLGQEVVRPQQRCGWLLLSLTCTHTGWRTQCRKNL